MLLLNRVPEKKTIKTLKKEVKKDQDQDQDQKDQNLRLLQENIFPTIHVILNALFTVNKAIQKIIIHQKINSHQKINIRLITGKIFKRKIVNHHFQEREILQSKEVVINKRKEVVSIKIDEEKIHTLQFLVKVIEKIKVLDVKVADFLIKV